MRWTLLLPAAALLALFGLGSAFVVPVPGRSPLSR